MRGLENQWAWSQVEAMADRSLSADDRQRMRAEMERDPSLRDAVERASALRRRLRGLSDEPVPLKVPLGLLRIPREASLDGWSGRGLWATAAATAVMLAVVLRVLWPESPPPDQRIAAVQDFEVAMTYLQRSAALTRREVAEAVGSGLQEALSVGREALPEDELNIGGEENGD